MSKKEMRGARRGYRCFGKKKRIHDPGGGEGMGQKGIEGSEL